MIEFLFAFFIMTGFLLGTLLFSNLLCYSVYLIPRYINLRINDNLKSPLQTFLKITSPVFLWFLVTATTVVLIFYFFNQYLILYLSGMAISLIFIFVDIVKSRKR